VRAILVGFLLLSTAPAQVRTETPEPSSAAETRSVRLLEENKYYRASLLELPAGARDVGVPSSHEVVVIVITGDAIVFTSSENSVPVTLSPGEVRFVKKGLHPVLANNAQNPAQVIFAALQQSWGAEIRACAEPMKCTHPIQTGPTQIGQSTTLFTNGFITAYRHYLVKGGDLSSSYFSSNGVDHLLLVALTDLRANFDGVEEQLTAGQVYASEASQVEVNASSGDARWIVIRVQTPKKAE
jgi:hypothetical protein